MTKTEITPEDLAQWRKNLEGLTVLSVVESDGWALQFNVYSKALGKKQSEWPKCYLTKDNTYFELVKVHPQVYKQNSYDKIDGFTGHAVYIHKGKITE